MSGFASRREFLKTIAKGTAIGMAAPYVLNSYALGGAVPPPSDRIRLGFIGINWMGGDHLTDMVGNQALRGAQVVAVCDCDEHHLAKAKSKVGANCKAYKDFRDLLDDQDVEAVLVAVPDHWHAIISIKAAEAGKDIYCEKPMSLTIREARAMVRAVRRYGRVFQTGSQQRTENCFRYGCELVRNGRLGKILTVHAAVGGPSGPCHLPAEPTPPYLDWNMWLGPAPVRPFNKGIHPVQWRSFMDYSGGGMTDWGAHHFDIAQWGLGMDNSGPVEVHPPDGKDYKSLTYTYANGITLIHGGTGGVVLTGTEGKLHLDRGVIESWPPDICRTPIGPADVHLYRAPQHGNPWTANKLDWLDCIRTRRRPCSDVEIGCRSITVCHLGNIAYWLNRPLRWDPEKEEIIGDAEAARWLDRPKRAPWTL